MVKPKAIIVADDYHRKMLMVGEVMKRIPIIPDYPACCMTILACNINNILLFMSYEGIFGSSSQHLTEAYRNWHIPDTIIINLKRVVQEFYWEYQPIKTQLLDCLIIDH